MNTLEWGGFGLNWLMYIFFLGGMIWDWATKVENDFVSPCLVNKSRYILCPLCLGNGLVIKS